MVVLPRSLSVQEAELDTLWVPGQTGQHNKILFQTKTTKLIK